MTTTVHKKFLYAAYGFLLLTGVMHFLIDVVRHHFAGLQEPGLAATYYYGLHSAYSLGQVLFALAAIMVIRSGSDLMSRAPGRMLSFSAIAGWFAICLLFMDYTPPWVNLVIVFALLTAAAATARTGAVRTD
jgi:hypothetical protein